MKEIENRKINILETTLRDGSYAVNFSFNAKDTALLCRKLEEVGFDLIEIGHGVGLNASNQGYGKAVQTDEEYMIAAEQSLEKARYGMFCIPGIAELKDIDLAHKHGMDFIRIGTNVTEIEDSEEFIKKARRYGMFVTANFMKSYAIPPSEFAKKVKQSEKYGAQMVYLVDSAGGMFPEDIERYYKAVRKVSDLPLGFHGHDNLGMAVANSVKAAEIGIEFIDASLQGLGRGGGNAGTEILVAALLKKNFELKIDLLRLLEVGNTFITPLLSSPGKMPLDVISGFAEFHSSYMPHIHRASAKYGVDPAILILEMCKLNKVDLDPSQLDEVAKKIQKKPDLFLAKYGFSRYVGQEQDERKKRRRPASKHI